MSPRDAMDLVDDDMPDGAYFALAAEIGGYDDISDFFEAVLAEEVNAMEDGDVFCPTCQKTFRTKAAQAQHAKAKGHAHYHARPYRCSCGRRFRAAQHLADHQRDTGHKEVP